MSKEQDRLIRLVAEEITSQYALLYGMHTYVDQVQAVRKMADELHQLRHAANLALNTK